MEYEEIMYLIKKLMRNMCLNEALCTIYSILAISEKPMSISQISEKTGYSSTMIYSSMKTLIEENLVEKVRIGKNIFYTANINFIDVFEKRRRKIMEEYIEPLSSIDLNKYHNNPRLKEIKEYAKNIKEYFMKINSIKNDQVTIKK